MSLKNLAARAVLYAVLEFGALCGVPVRVDQIEELLKLNDRAAPTDVKRTPDGDGPPRKGRPEGSVD